MQLAFGLTCIHTYAYIFYHPQLDMAKGQIIKLQVLIQTVDALYFVGELHPTRIDRINIHSIPSCYPRGKLVRQLPIFFEPLEDRVEA